MISEELQYRVHRGERDAFMTLYSESAKNVYLRAFSATADENCAKEAVKRVFSSVYRELRAASGPMDLDARIAKLTDEAIMDLRVRGLPGPEPAKEDAFLPEEPAAAEPPPAPEQPEPLPERPVRETSHRHKKHKKPRAGNGLLTLLIVLLILIILWMVCGIAMDLGILPYMDLGYRWFNETVYPMFNLGGGVQ